MKYSVTNIQDAKLSVLSGFALAVLVFSVTRGLVPLVANNGSLAQPTYYAASFLGVVLSCYGLYLALFTDSQVIGTWLRRVLVINFFLHLYWLAPLIILRPEFEVLVGVIYTGLFPFSIYALIKIPEKLLIPVLGLLTLVISGFVIFDFISINTPLIPDGYTRAFERQTLLRPDFEGYSSTGVILRPLGLLGVLLPHDSGNLLAIFFVYWLAMLFQVRSYKLLTSVVAIVALIGLLFTQSASNIIVAFVGVVFLLLAYRRLLSSHSGIFAMLILLPISIVVIWGFTHFELDLDLLWAWSDRLSEEGYREGFLRNHVTDLGTDLFVLLFGHAISLELSPIASVEFGLLKGLIELGLVQAIILYALLLYPCALFFSRKFRVHRYRVIPYIAAVGVGFLSLVHYGSVLRATNIFVFFALYAQALRIFTEARDGQRSRLVHSSQAPDAHPTSEEALLRKSR